MELFLARGKTTEEVQMESTENFWDRAVNSDESKSRDTTGEDEGIRIVVTFLLQLVYTHIGIYL